MTNSSDVKTCLAQVSQVKDLGVWLINTLSPTLQCQKAANKAMQVMGIIRRSLLNISLKSPFTFI